MYLLKNTLQEVCKISMFYHKDCTGVKCNSNNECIYNVDQAVCQQQCNSECVKKAFQIKDYEYFSISTLNINSLYICPMASKSFFLPFYSMLIGVFSGVLLLVIIIIIAVKCSKKDNKKQQLKQKIVQQAYQQEMQKQFLKQSLELQQQMFEYKSHSRKSSALSQNKLNPIKLSRNNSQYIKSFCSNNNSEISDIDTINNTPQYPQPRTQHVSTKTLFKLK